MERHIALKGFKQPEQIADRVERVAEQAYAQGWFFVSAAADEWMETLTLFFEKDMDV